MKKIVGYIFIIISIFITGYVLYNNSKYSETVPAFSPYTLLTSSWEKYKTQFINVDGRVLDHSQNDVTTSEGQSYALLRAVEVDDKATFDKVWNWTKNTLKRPTDNLFGWRWGNKGNNTYGFIANGGQNSASDADEDIALSLILASRRWNSSEYSNAALPILNAIWNVETATVSGQRYLVAGNWARSETGIILNPSYFAPYAWRIFAKVDTRHDWKSLITPAYNLLRIVSQSPLDKNKAVGLAPDWVSMDTKNGAVLPTKIPNLTTDYSYDAMRVPWRIYVDYKWDSSTQAKNYLDIACKKLENDFSKTGKLASVYSHNGNVINPNESPAMYGTSLGCFMYQNQTAAKQIYQDKIVRLYSNGKNAFNSNLSYYDQNWLWFGAALYNNQILNFSQ